MTFTDTPWFEFFRLVALALIYAMFLLQLFSLRFAYRQYKEWAEEEAARRKRWAEDMAVIGKLKTEAEHLRHQTEYALAQARRHLPNATDNRTGG